MKIAACTVGEQVLSVCLSERAVEKYLHYRMWPLGGTGVPKSSGAASASFVACSGKEGRMEGRKAPVELQQVVYLL